MRLIGLAGLFLCLGMVGGVRGQEVITKNPLTGMPSNPSTDTPLLLQNTEIMEVLSYTYPSGGWHDFALWIFAIESDLPNDQWWTISNFQLGLGSSKTYHSFSVPTPVIVGGPAKVFFKDLNSITYRIVPKAGYSPNISPTSLASNTNFVSGLTQTILSTSNSYGLASRTELIQALAESRADGVNSVLNNPNQWTLYTTNQIHTMAIGDLVLTSTNNGSFVLNYDIEQSEDLVNWYPYQGFAMPLTNLPTNKAFVRIKAKQ